jgi:hypothetical protein
MDGERLYTKALKIRRDLVKDQGRVQLQAADDDNFEAFDMLVRIIER